MHITCCNKCPDRHPCCHSHCEKYIKQANDLKKYNDSVKKERQTNMAIYDIRHGRFSRKNTSLL